MLKLHQAAVALSSKLWKQNDRLQDVCLFVKFEEVSSNIKSEQTNKQTNKMKIDNAAARKLINNHRINWIKVQLQCDERQQQLMKQLWAALPQTQIKQNLWSWFATATNKRTNKQWETKRKTLKLICNSNQQTNEQTVGNKKKNFEADLQQQQTKQTAEKINLNTGIFLKNKMSTTTNKHWF